MVSNTRHKSILLKSIQREFDALMAVVERLSPEQMVTPDAGGWSPKDNLAHLTEWLKALLGFHIDRKSAEEVLGIPKELAEEWDFNRV
ncbi:MAG: ClbS/DfsB family four-helix bundle protein, partial [Chloroflexota bacterium]